jgi:hypothetical protein
MGWLDKGPGYTVNDLVWWSGLITGVVVCFFLLTPLGVPRLVSLVVGGGGRHRPRLGPGNVVPEQPFPEAARRGGGPAPLLSRAAEWLPPLSVWARAAIRNVLAFRAYSFSGGCHEGASEHQAYL